VTDAGDGPGSASTGLDEFAQHWAQLIARVSYVPVRLDDLRQVLRGYAARLVGAGGGGQAAAREVGAALVADGYTNTDAVQATITALADRLPTGATDRAALLGGVAAGYARALRERTQRELESIIRAVLTARRTAERARAASEARFEALFVSSASGICVVDPENRIVQANPALARMLGRPAAELDRRRLTGLSQPDHREAVERTLDDLHTGRRAHTELDAAFSRPDGNTVWLRLSLAPVRHDAMTHLVVTAQDDTERYHLQSALSHQALHDPLTNLPNRTLLLRRLDELVDGLRPDEHIGICYLDLDGFKTINDSFGHAAGDDVLRAVAGRLAGCLSEPGWLAGRLGGDEFVIVADAGTELDELERMAERVVSAVREPIAAAGHQLSVSVSIGVTGDRIPHSQPGDLMRAADIALYWAKAAGGDRYEVYDANRHDAQALRSTLSSGLRSALQRGDFALRYQPIVRLADGVPVGAEVLLRWTHPEHGPIAPEIFIDLAEELGLIGQLGRWVLTRGCREAAGWYRELGDRAPFISVNLSARQLHDVGLADELLRTLDEVGLPAHQLQLELTESALLGPAQGPADALEALAEHGVRVAVDDFGTGYSNLAYLRRLPVRELKIAGSFIEGLAPGHPSTPADRQIVASVIALAHGLNLTVTAEGVETEEQAHLLRTMGCDHAQGWWFARPGDPEVINRMAGGQAGYSVDPVTTP
jgi:diguanylate cyclase (GGDEF)-like protein/PAS domain S-box-containing protein